MSDKIRLLICNDCGSVDELPWYEGPSEYDTWLNSKVLEHTTPSGTPHIGNLAAIEREKWLQKSVRDAIIKEIYQYVRPAGYGAGLGETHYDTKNNFLDDAMRCWKSFNRTTNPGHCDYRKENKRLLPDTVAERKDLGLDPKTRPNTFLCDFCPLQMVVERKAREKAGQYN